MAFTGTATVKQISDSIVRITGLSLAASAAGTIGLTGKTSPPEVTLPASFKTQHYTYDGVNVPFADAIDVTVKLAATNVATATPIAVVKTGTSLADFLITLTNVNGSTASGAFEIYVKFHE